MSRARRAFNREAPLVDHLEELRRRIIVCLLTVTAMTVFCFWQSGRILEFANRPLPSDALLITLSPTEPLMTTLTVCVCAGLVLSLPMLLHQFWAFTGPALSPAQRNAMRPVLIAIPLLFISGAVFAFFVVVPAAAQFLLSFSQENFTITIRARDYYSFLATTVVGIGVAFEVPVVLLALVKIGLVTPEALAGNRRIALFVISIVAAVGNGSPDPFSMILMMIPLYLMYEASVLIAKHLTPIAGRSRGSTHSGPAR